MHDPQLKINALFRIVQYWWLIITKIQYSIISIDFNEIYFRSKYKWVIFLIHTLIFLNSMIVPDSGPNLLRYLENFEIEKHNISFFDFSYQKTHFLNEHVWTFQSKPTNQSTLKFLNAMLSRFKTSQNFKIIFKILLRLNIYW